MDSERDVWLEAGVVWAVATGALPDVASRNLTQRAVSMASETRNYRLLLDYRRATLTHDVLALNRHAEMLSRLGLPQEVRVAMLCRERSSNFQFWERVLRMRGLSAAVFTDGKPALSWLMRSETGLAVADAADAADAAGAAPNNALLDVDSLKRLVQRFAVERSSVPRSQVQAEFTELLECLFAHADQLGIDLMQATEIQLRLVICEADHAS
jgi:hypothetical protein